MKDSMKEIECQLVIKYLALILTVLFTSAFTIAFPLPASATDWETFSPPSKEYSISLPVGFSKITRDDGMDAVMYSASDGDINFLVDDGSELNPFGLGQHDQFTQEVTDGMTEKLRSEGIQNVETSVEKLEGKGWFGKKTTVVIEGNKAITLVVAVAKSGDVAYTLMATASDDNPKVANFFKSLTVDPALASEAHKEKSVAYKVGTSAGKVVVWFVLLGFLVGLPGLVWLIGLLVKKKKRNTD